MRTFILDGSFLAQACGRARESLTDTAATVLLAAALLIVSLHNALHSSLRVVQTSDSAQSFVAGHAVVHGNILLSGWNVPKDDYFFTDTMPYAVLEWLVGPRPILLALVPALNYAAFALLVFLLLAWPAKRPLQSVENCAAVSLMLAIPVGIGDWNPLLMSDMHFASVVASLLALSLCCRLVERNPRSLWEHAGLGAGLVVVTAATVASDPFSLVFAFAPALVLLGVDAIRGAKAEGTALVILAAGVLLGLALPAMIAFAGGFTTEDITVAGAAAWPLVVRNVTAILAGMASLFGANSFSQGAARPLLPALHAVALAVASAAVAGGAGRLFGRDRAQLLDRLLCAGILSGLAACALSVQFGKGITPQALLTGGPPMRYVMPAALFAAVLGTRSLPRWIAALPGRQPKAVARATLVLLAALLVAEGWNGTADTAQVENKPATSVARWLEQRGLARGAGEYWSANIVTAMSGNDVQIGSVVPRDGRLVPYVLAADGNWFAKPPEFAIWRDENPTGVTLEDVRATYDICRVDVVAGFRVAVLRGPGRPRCASRVPREAGKAD